MASAAGPFPIFYTPDVHNFYVKQKHEFHFNQKSDNDFLMFLLDTAVRVISIVQHLAPVIEAVSEASIDIDEELSADNNLDSLTISGTMDVDIAPLSAELEQINQEITNAQVNSLPSSQITSKPNSQLTSQPNFTTSKPISQLTSHSNYTNSQPHYTNSQPHYTTPQPNYTTPKPNYATSHLSQTSDIEVLQSIPAQTGVPVVQPVFQPYSSGRSTSLAHTSPLSTTNLEISQDSTDSAGYTDTDPPLTPNVPATQLPTFAQSSENLSTVLPHATQPIAEAPSTDEVKSEQPVPEVIEIKEEIDESIDQGLSTNLIPSDTLQQLMSSISGAEDSSGLQNFVPTATLSSLPPSFLDRSSHNPLSMVGSLNSVDGPGPSGIHVPNISESMMKNISDAGLNVSSIKGQANPIDVRQCPLCHKEFSFAKSVSEHVISVHMKRRPFSCKYCHKTFGTQPASNRHENHHCPKNPNKGFRSRSFSCEYCHVTFRTQTAAHKHQNMHCPSNSNRGGC